ncbi:3-isopropylmalate dehydratase [Pseudomonas sp. 10B1]|uniref:3-isopropylmalate dehydratase n=1 Tax=unclassified Pseudomonas TaxID=196821 RepID=UPI002AB4F3C8|nr:MULTISPECIES: 3-isopropylmalate dehydratase [unclassified Pseudomonas]MDY7560617.1 3-isopropylmalate dehydratase [Pseudomonas sp. AB6]MEA9993373.1 3-isopropylmalate dehydratase [Pseudomonas sp. AA4]MEB0088377.1 3-isopropylmalate dehydratase [Pseudomonas sp. RTI1]MEB0124140.1 3-isopropylmalate dehydratase [Pseudomonas sp. CCC1.2]MEB0152599.1 3-isopropylmalate dehydratase [Pseudomonas sp. CCC4.3]
MRLICFAIPLLLAGCSSFTADPDKVTHVPAERLLAFQQPVEGAGGQIIVNRDIGMLGGGCYVAFSIDRTVAARIGIGEEAHFQAPAGARIVGIGLDEQDGSMCSKGRLHRELAVQLKSGASQYFRIVSDSVSGFGIVAVAQ